MTLKNDVNGPSKGNKCKNWRLEEGPWRKEQDSEQEPDPLVKGTVQIRGLYDTFST
jgi:hypothetical protein